MGKDKIVIMNWGGVIENHCEENFIFNPELKHVLQQFSETPIPNNYQEMMMNALKARNVTLNDMGKSKNIRLYVDKLFECFGMEGYPEMYTDFMDTYTQFTSHLGYDRELVRYITGIKDRCKIGILSNCIAIDAGRQNKEVGWNNFDYKWLSYEMAHVISEPEVPDIIEKDCGLKGSQILYVEDTEENLKRFSEERGWKTYKATYKATQNTIDAIERFLAED